jgi:hypothetical protein
MNILADLQYEHNANLFILSIMILYDWNTGI